MDNTKAVQLTEDEVQVVIQYHARQIIQSTGVTPDYVNSIERMRYLDKRLKDFKPVPATAEWGKTNG